MISGFCGVLCCHLCEWSDLMQIARDDLHQVTDKYFLQLAVAKLRHRFCDQPGEARWWLEIVLILKSCTQ